MPENAFECFKEKKDMKKTILIISTIALILNACATSPVPLSTPTATLVPPTRTPLPPTPDLDDILPPEVSKEYTLETDDYEIFYLQDEDGNIISEISIDVNGNILFGKEKIPVTLTLEEDGILAITTEDEKTLLLDGKKWVEIIKNLPPNLPDGYFYNNPNQNKENLIGATITTAEKKPLFAYFRKNGSEEGEWIKDFPSCDIDHYYECVVTEEDIESGKYFTWLELQAQIMANEIDWDNISSDDFDTVGWGYVGSMLYPLNHNTGVINSNLEIKDERSSKTFGILEETELGQNSILIPTFIIDLSTKSIQVIQGKSTEWSDTRLQIDIFKGMPANAIQLHSRTPFTNETDLLVQKTFDKYPNIKEECFDPFLIDDEYDRSGLSGSDKIFIIHITDNEHWQSK